MTDINLKYKKAMRELAAQAQAEGVAIAMAALTPEGVVYEAKGPIIAVVGLTSGLQQAMTDHLVAVMRRDTAMVEAALNPPPAETPAETPAEPTKAKRVIRKRSAN